MSLTAVLAPLTKEHSQAAKQGELCACNIGRSPRLSINAQNDRQVLIVTRHCGDLEVFK